jgi:hypothetical protein
MARRAFEICTLLGAVDGVVTFELAVGDSVAVSVVCSVQEDSRPSQISSRVHSRQVSAVHFDGQPTQELGDKRIAATYQTVLHRRDRRIGATFVHTRVQIDTHPRTVVPCPRFQVNVERVGRTRRRIDEDEFASAACKNSVVQHETMLAAVELPRERVPSTRHAIGVCSASDVVACSCNR